MPEKKHKQNVEDLRGLGETELADVLSNERRKLYEARGKNVTRQLENPSAISAIKKQIARILTIQNERRAALE